MKRLPLRTNELRPIYENIDYAAKHLLQLILDLEDKKQLDDIDSHLWKLHFLATALDLASTNVKEIIKHEQKEIAAEKQKKLEQVS